MIEILLSTYNGEKYLPEQLDSLLAQSIQTWRLLIRDDGSSDSTMDILRDYETKYPEKIQILNDDCGNLGSGGSFAELMRRSTAEYVMFCDQDDVWLPEKIELTLAEIRRLETQYPNVPLLVGTDLTVVDEKKSVIASSFIKSQKLYPEAMQNVYRSLALSVAPGCTMILNRMAVNRVLPVPKGHGHDHWVAFLVAYYGKVSFVNTPTILYRQHGRNVCGNKNIGIAYFAGRLCRIFSVAKAHYEVWRALPFAANPFKYLYYIVYYAVKRSL